MLIGLTAAKMVGPKPKATFPITEYIRESAVDRPISTKSHVHSTLLLIRIMNERESVSRDSPIEHNHTRDGSQPHILAGDVVDGAKKTVFS